MNETFSLVLRVSTDHGFCVCNSCRFFPCQSLGTAKGLPTCSASPRSLFLDSGGIGT